MKKGVFVCVFALMLMVVMPIVFVSAANETTTNSEDMVDKGYTCLENAVKNKTTTLQNAIFASLALGSRSNIDKIISNEKKANADCWPKAGCTLKETAQVALVYFREGKNTDAIENWLLTKNSTMGDLIWYLEIDSTDHKNATCKIKYDSTERTILIRDDMKIEADPTGCYDLSDKGYWLKISPSCYSKKFDITCNKDFATALVYMKSNSDTVFVSSETHSQASNDATSEEIKAKCFKTGSVCDYEGTLWSVLALKRTGNDVSAYLPFLIALAEDNVRYFPSSFLYLLDVGQDQFSEIVNSQKSNKYWEISGSPGGRQYDTSLALMALSDNPTTQSDNAKSYLLSIQDKNTGCWGGGNIRDTAFILYSGWPREATGAGEGSTSNSATCASIGKTCVKASECDGAGGTILSDNLCPNFGEFCCSVSVQKKTCLEQGGEICTSSQVCDGRSSSALDGACCLDGCKAKPAEDTCTAGDGICRESCDDNEEEVDAICSTSGNICCKANATPEPKSFSWFWIFLLVLLIILIALAIVYRDRLKMQWLKFKGKASSAPVSRRVSPNVPGSFMGHPAPPSQGMFGRPGIPVGRPMPHPVIRPNMPPRPNAPVDKDMEETLRKLKEMSK